MSYFVRWLAGCDRIRKISSWRPIRHVMSLGLVLVAWTVTAANVAEEIDGPWK